MREPLVLPATALFVGIWLGRAFAFSLSEAMWPGAAFLCLAFLARGNLRRGCVLLALLMSGAFTEAWHRAGPPPYIEAGSRETVLLEGCVVEPAALTPGRMQFTLELAQLGPDCCIVRESMNSPPCTAELHISVDGDVRRRPIFLPQGLSTDSKTVVIRSA